MPSQELFRIGGPLPEILGLFIMHDDTGHLQWNTSTITCSYYLDKFG